MTKSQKIDHIQQNDRVTKIGVSFLGVEKKKIWQMLSDNHIVVLPTKKKQFRNEP